MHDHPQMFAAIVFLKTPGLDTCQTQMLYSFESALNLHNSSLGSVNKDCFKTQQTLFLENIFQHHRHLLVSLKVLKSTIEVIDIKSICSKYLQVLTLLKMWSMLASHYFSNRGHIHSPSLFKSIMMMVEQFKALRLGFLLVSLQ